VLVNVQRAHPAIWAAAADLGDVQAQFTGQLAGGRHGQDAFCADGRGLDSRNLQHGSSARRPQPTDPQLLGVLDHLEEAGVDLFILKRCGGRCRGLPCRRNIGAGKLCIQNLGIRTLFVQNLGVRKQGQSGVNGHYRAFRGQVFFQHARKRAGQFHRHLIGHDLADGLLQLDALSLLHQPFQNLTLDHALSQFRHQQLP